MSESNSRAQALERLEQPRNEPLRWLLGDVLRQHAECGMGRHFLLEDLSEAEATERTAYWNASIHLYRDLLTNPDAAAKKANHELRCSSKKDDAEAKLRAFVAEIETPIHLSRTGYSDFEVVLQGGQASPDLLARFEGSQSLIEVKNLEEPTDVIDNIVVSHWRNRQAENPSKYCFGIRLRHSHKGRLTRSEESRLRTILDQFPEGRPPTVIETLDNKVEVQISRLNSARPSEIIINSEVSEHDFANCITDRQRLLLKAIRPVTDSLKKFFGASYFENSDRSKSVNVVAMKWNPPDPFYDPTLPEMIGSSIEQLFLAFNMKLKPILFLQPDLPWDVLKLYSSPRNDREIARKIRQLSSDYL